MPSLSESIQKSARLAPARNQAWLHHLIIALTLLTALAAYLVPERAALEFEALLLILATVASLGALARQLPLQSVLFAALITAVIGSAAHGLSRETAIPLGPVSFGDAAGPKLFKTVPWCVSLFWVFAIFNSRGVARLILRPWRTARNYGFILIATTAGLALLFDLALEPYAYLHHFWLWQPTKIHLTWYRATPLSFIGWTFVAMIILAVILPYLIRKQPGNPTAPDWTPLMLWLGAVIFFGAGLAQAKFWPAVILNATVVALVLLFAWRGGKK
jgi:uncharacterized membrane protein